MTTNPILGQFVERIGLALEKEGLPRIAGRILGFVLSRPEAVLQDDLVSELQVSRGSVSTNTRLLESLGVLERVSIAGDRRVRYRLSEDPFSRFLEATVERIGQRQRIIREGLEGVPDTEPEVGRRFRSMLRFNELAMGNMRELLASWRAEGVALPVRSDVTADRGGDNSGAGAKASVRRPVSKGRTKSRNH